MGVTGAALATIIGQFGAAILSIYLFSRHNEHIHISFKHFKIDFQVFKNLYSIAIPSGVMTVSYTHLEGEVHPRNGYAHK